MLNFLFNCVAEASKIILNARWRYQKYCTKFVVYVGKKNWIVRHVEIKNWRKMTTKNHFKNVQFFVQFWRFQLSQCSIFCLIQSQKHQKSFWTQVEDIKNILLRSGDTLVKNLDRTTRGNNKLKENDKKIVSKMKSQFWRFQLPKCSIFC